MHLWQNSVKRLLKYARRSHLLTKLPIFSPALCYFSWVLNNILLDWPTVAFKFSQWLSDRVSGVRDIDWGRVKAQTVALSWFLIIFLLVAKDFIYPLDMDMETSEIKRRSATTNATDSLPYFHQLIFWILLKLYDSQLYPSYCLIMNYKRVQWLARIN